ncbi:MAG TPA: hypothetical protein VLF40_03235 [Candidatus Saccharimonadales bacterium]|nr:hypothetical protein [Candidatus Saccharimonadales bacterium]
MTHPETLAVVGSIHGNEPFGQAVHRAIQADPAFATAGIVSTEGHPEALAAGERFLGNESELGSLLPGDPNSPNPDRRAAARLHDWLDGQNAWLAVSLHDNDGAMRGSNYLALGASTTVGQLAVAHVVGVRDIMVTAGYAFFTAHPEVVEIEQAVQAGNEQRKVTEMLGHLWRLQELGPEGLAGLYDGAGLRFYLRLGSFLLEKGGRPNQFILDRLDRLEAVFADRDPSDIARFEALPLPEDLKEELGLGGLQLAVSSWNHINSSRLADRGVSPQGIRRREVLGSCLVQTQPQIDADGTVTFPPLERDLSHWR